MSLSQALNQFAQNLGRYHTPLPVFKVRMRATNMLRRFVLIGGFDIDDAYDTDTQDGMEGKHH